MRIDDKVLSDIDEQIEEIGLEFARTQGSILTEDDLKCILYSRLIRLPFFAKPETTKDSWITANYVHSEVSWFDSASKLTIKPDLTILDPQDLSITHGVQNRIQLPSKGFHVYGNAIIFELKFVRGAKGITERTLQTIRKDVDKIKQLYDKMLHDGSTFKLICYIVFFAKVNNKRNKLIKNFQEEMKGDKHFRVFYKCANVSFTDPNAS
jgi:hypothetical protein